MTDPSSAVDVRVLGARIRRECLRRGWDIVQLADAAGVSRTTLYHLEHGHTRRVRSSTINAIAGALGVSVDDLMGSPPVASAPPSSAAKSASAATFDRATNPAVEDVVRERPAMFQGWSDDDWDELYSQFGVGGALTPLGVLSAAEAINEKRETIRKLHVVLDTHLRDVAREIIDTFYRSVQAGGGSEAPRAKETPGESPS
jgi:transcriptional regulator with XRE-family HTH domain